MQRARCYLLGETAVVLELEPPITLATQKRIWRLASVWLMPRMYWKLFQA